MITSIEKVESYLLITVDEDFRDEVEDFIEAVQAYVERFTGRTFSADSEATARLYDGSGTGELWIDDAAEVTEVKIDGEVLTTDEYVTYPANRKPITRIILHYRVFREAAQNVSVKAKWGYGAAVPADLELAATMLVADIINVANTVGGGDVASETIGRYSVTYTTGSSPANASPEALRAHKILKLYRRMS
jgi:hypothetical protein